MIRLARFLQTIGLAVVLSLPVFSQGSQGAIQGAVFDSSGANIPGVTVTITDVDRGTTRVLISGEAGQYAATGLTAGTYKVRAELAGFTTVERNNVRVEVGNNTRVDLTLMPGGQAETITITEEVSAVNTASATLGGIVSNQAIAALPLNGRNFFRLLELRPGVVTVPGSGSGSSSSNGRRLGADVLLVEGITQFDMATSNNLINGSGKGAGGDASNMLPLDAIQEFNTQQNAPAEYGWRDGSVVNVGIKSGTNALHGSAYAFYRNAKLTDAANFFTGSVTPATLKQYGGTLGGSIVKDKLFWFAAFEGLRININSISSVVAPTSIGLTPANPNLSMVDACNAIRASGGTINLLSARLAGLNTATCVVSPASSTFENVFAYNPTTSTVFYPGNPASQPLNNGLAKVDWNVNQRNHISGFYYDSRADSTGGTSLQPYWTTLGISKTKEYSGGWTWTPNSAWVNELRAGWAGALGDQEPADVNKLPSDPWPAGYSTNTGVTKREYGGFPVVTFTSGLQNLGVSAKAGIRGPQGQLNIRDSVSYLSGNHSFKFGFEHIWVKFNDGSHANVSGTVDFADLTNFLQGTPIGGGIVNGNTDERLRARWYAGFFQDTWRITPRITLTPGVRYEYSGSPHEVDNLLGTFDPTIRGGIARIRVDRPRLYNPEKLNLSPRIGVAWDMRGNAKTVLRAGISRLSSIPGITALAAATPFGANIPSIGLDRSGLDINKSFPNALAFTGSQLSWNTTGPIFPIGSAAGPSCTVAVPCGTFATDPNFKKPKSIQWNVDIQRALTNQLTLDIAYVGNHGYDETHSIDLNAVPVGTGWTPTVIANCITNGGTGANGCRVDNNAITAARPFNAQFPYYNYIVRSTSGFWSNYSGLQVTLEGRNFHGLTFLTAYTYGHALDMWTKSSQGTQVLVDPTNPRLQYGNSDQDLRHRFRFSPSYTLPSLKVPGQMLEGWTISGVLALQGGFPWGAIDSTRNDWIGTGENLNSVVPSPNSGVLQSWNYKGPREAFNSSNVPIPCYGRLNGCAAFASAPLQIQQLCNDAAQAPYIGNPTQQRLALRALENNACYVSGDGVLTPPAYGTYGNAGRNSFRGPGFKNVDLSISKTWRLKEATRVEFRTEFFNAFNHPNFGAPGTNPTTGSAGGFGFARNTPDASNAVLGSGGPRHIQFGLKFAF
jgi:carboxypeptidase family protein/TonB-dependent receptor-like protein